MPVKTCASIAANGVLAVRLFAFKRARLVSNSAALLPACSRALLADASTIELATIEATRPRSGPTSPLPSGCTR
ncbi:MAG TPA: hypothetical protein VNT76_17580, partial [Candidatus Binatus sp.]|nr:hypothetical protein [Candidatus Binatus sp.]